MVAECGYYQGRDSKVCFYEMHQMSPKQAQELMDRGFRRTGYFFYRPFCGHCEECIPMRVKVWDFVWKPSFRRIMKKNRDLRLHVSEEPVGEDAFRLYREYQQAKHGEDMNYDRAEFEMIFHAKPCPTFSLQARLEDELVGVAHVDASSNGLSSLYSYYSPKYPKRSLGIWLCLQTLVQAEKEKLMWWYPGTYLKGHPKMDYKKRFQPAQLYLLKTHEWVDFSGLVSR